MVVIACNTATALALPVLKAALDPVPVIGVVEPGARAAVEASPDQRIGVLATEATVRGGAYARAIHALRPQAQVSQIACPLFVALAEEGWTQGPVPELAAERY
ncbi:MAG TPA: glutamate racemase, partial [Alphaproteobacteria bacterium]|nr:glutamate racemase [Alphaproteobacteria bacterium]